MQSFCWDWSLGIPEGLVGLTIGDGGYQRLDVVPNYFAFNSDRCITVPSLPDSQNLFVRVGGLMWWLGSGGTWLWQYNEMKIVNGGATDQSQDPSVSSIQRPEPGTSLSSNAQTFWWSDSEASQYHLQIGSHIGGNDIFDKLISGGKRAETVWGLPVDGNRIYVRLGSQDKSTKMWGYKDYEYVASSTNITPSAATLVGFPNTHVDGEPLRFEWNDVGSHLYFLRISKCGYDYYGTADFFAERFSPDNTSVEISGHVTTYPYDLYIRLYTWSSINNDWVFSEYTNKYGGMPTLDNVSDYCRHLLPWTGTSGEVEYTLIRPVIK